VKTKGVNRLYGMPQTCSELFWAQFESYLPWAKGQTALNSSSALNVAKQTIQTLLLCCLSTFTSSWPWVPQRCATTTNGKVHV